MFRKNRSFVWDHFEKKSNSSALCLLCKNMFKCKNNTSNLRDHLKRKHFANNLLVVEVESYPDESEQGEVDPNASTSMSLMSSLTDTVTTSTSLADPEELAPRKRSKKFTLHSECKSGEWNSEKIHRLNLLVAGMVVEDLQPPSVVENSGFKKLVQELEPRYFPPSQQDLTCSILPTIYESKKQSLQSKLDATDYISITTDIWTSSNSSFMTVTSHFFCVENNLESNVLVTLQLPENYTAGNLANELKCKLRDWNVSNKVVAAVTDGEANIKAAIKKLGIQHFPCIAHTLNLVIQLSITNTTDLLDIIENCRNLVTYFKSNEIAAETLRTIQAEMGVVELKLKMDVSTRWNSTLHMLERLLELKEAVSAALASLSTTPIPLTEDQWIIVEDCVILFKPLETMTIELSAEEYPTLSMIIPLVRGVLLHIRHKQPTTEVGGILKNNIIKELNDQLGKVEQMNLPAAATLLDPRFKKAAFGNEANAENIYQNMLHQLSLLYQHYLDAISSENLTQTSTNGDLSDYRENLWEFLETKVSTSRISSNPSSDAADMLRQFLELPYENRRSNPSVFWQKHKSALEPLFKLSQKYLSIPATCVPAERIFSKAGEIMFEKRNRLKPKHLDMLIFLNKNV